MSRLTRIAYRMEKPILYNNVNTETLYGVTLLPDNIPLVGGYRWVLEGSYLAAGGRLLPRAKILSPYTSGATTVIVNNPMAFKVGDVLKVIGVPGDTPMDEYDAVAGATAADFGTVTAIEPSVEKQITTVTPASVAVNDVYTLTIAGVTVSFTATTTSAADVANGLKKLFDSQASQSSALSQDGLRLSVAGSVLTIESLQSREIFEVTGSVVGTGTAAIAVTQALGRLTITPASGNGNQVIGTKIGTITNIPLGVIAHEYYLTSDDDEDMDQDVAAYNMAAINTKALPYLDGHIERVLPRLSYIPVYGS